MGHEEVRQYNCARRVIRAEFYRGHTDAIAGEFERGWRGVGHQPHLGVSVMESCPTARVSIVVPVRNAERTIGDCIGSLLRLRYPAARRDIIVVDNGSSDASCELIRGFPVRLVSEPRRGPSWARNAGIERSTGDIIAFIDADCIAATRWLRCLVAAFADPTVSAVAGEILAYPPHSWAEYYMARRKSHWQRAALAAERPYIVSANFAVRRAVLERIGLFDPRFLIGQDQDFSWRLFAAGLRVEYAPEAVVFHRHRSTTWQFVRQQAGWARGAMFLRRHHGLAWRLRDEVVEYRNLLHAVGRLAVACPGGLRAGPGRAELAYRFHDALRETARRAVTLSAYARRGLGAIAGPALVRRHGSPRPGVARHDPRPEPAASRSGQAAPCADDRRPDD
jgi:glycosyltransferase involved in cell wall biosynthesis